jgi:hypothetical protein
MDIILRQQTRLSPTSIVKDSNTTGAVEDIDEEVDSPDGSKIEVVDEAQNYLVRFQFTPPPNITPGGGLQTFRAWVMKNEAGGGDPFCGMTLAEGGASLRALNSPAVETEAGQLVEGTFDAAEIGVDADTECRLDGQTSGDRNVDIDAVEWVATHDASIAPEFSAGTPTLSAPTEILAPSIAAADAVGEPSLAPVIAAGSIAAEFAAGEPLLSNVGGTISPPSIAEGFLAGTPSLGIFSLIEAPSIAAAVAAGEPTVTLGTALISMQSIGPETVSGIPVVRRVDVPPELANRLKPGGFRMVD